MATFWEIAARSVSNLFSLYFVYLKYIFISRFGFKSGVCLLIAPVPVHCFSITFKKVSSLVLIIPSVSRQNMFNCRSCIIIIRKYEFITL